MTFTITAWDRETGAYGLCLATSSPAVGNRCIFARSRVGAVAFQAVAEPRLGALGMRLLDFGYSAGKTMAELLGSDRFPEKRQIAIIDRDGAMAVHTGEKNMDYAGHHVGADYIAMGNNLRSRAVVEGIAAAYERARTSGTGFAQSLLAAIEGGRDAGGQVEGQTSAAILVFTNDEFADLDLRVDVHDEPVGELRRIVDWFEPLVPYYRERARNPYVPRAKTWLAEQGIARKFGHG